MILLQIIVLFSLILNYIFEHYSTIGPLDILRLPWDRQLINKHYLDMTTELAKDATLKLRLADHYVEMHKGKGSINFELGNIAGGIFEKYRFMIRRYRRYANKERLMRQFASHGLYHLMPPIYHAFSVIHGAYNEILHDRRQFFQLLREHEESKVFTRTVVTQSVLNSVYDLPDDVQKELSLQAYHSLDDNNTDYRKFDLKDLYKPMTSRRHNMYWWYGYTSKRLQNEHYWVTHPAHHDIVLKTCMFHTITYRSAMVDLTSYFDLRQLYLNTFEYEVGYLTHQILFKYENMLEIYHMVSKRFLDKNYNTNMAPPPYVFYLYKSLLAQSKLVQHLCNMLHELAKKYKPPGLGIWDDYHLYSGNKPRCGPSSENGSSNNVREMSQAVNDFIIPKRKEQAKKRKIRKKQMNNVDFLHTWVWKEVSRQPKKGPWEMEYGWSIEKWP